MAGGQRLVEANGVWGAANDVEGEIDHLQAGSGARARQSHVRLPALECAFAVDLDEIEGTALDLVYGQGPRGFERHLRPHTPDIIDQ